MIRAIRNIVRCEAGATAIEYGLIAGMIGLLIIALVSQIGSDVLDLLRGLTGWT